MRALKEKGTTIQQWLIRKHRKIKAVRNINKYKNILNNTTVTRQQLDRRTKLRRQHKNNQHLTLNRDKTFHEDLREYGNPFASATDTLIKNMIRIYSHNINNMHHYATKLKNRSIINELKTKIADIQLW